MKLFATLTLAAALSATLVQTAAAATPKLTLQGQPLVSFTPNPFPQPLPRPVPRPFPFPNPCLSCPPFPIQDGGLQIQPVLR